MSHLWTRAEFRDQIRRALGIVPPIDIPGSMAIPGQQPTQAPYPTNQQINNALQDFIDDCNVQTGFHVTQFDVPVNAADSATYGPFGIYLGDMTPNSTGTTTLLKPTGLMMDVQRVLWTVAGGGPPLLLQPTYRDQQDRAGNNAYYAMLPSLPQYWWIEGYVLYITPAQFESGVYNLVCGSGIIGLQCDDQTLDQVPISYQHLFKDGAIYRLSITQTMDIEAQTRAQAYGPLAQQAIRELKEWKLGNTGAPQPQLIFQPTYRIGYGTRRTRR